MDNIPLNPKLRYMATEFDTHFKVFHELMSIKVLEILLVASAYDAYILEEDGSLASRIINEYHGLNLSRPPRITRVEGGESALESIKRQSFDLVLTMPHLEDIDPFALGLSIKALKPNLPVILLAHGIQGFFPLPTNKDCSGIDQIFIWSGDADLLLAIVKSVEDRFNVENDTRMAQVRVIILVEDSPLYRSYFLPLMYKEVVHQTQEVLDESLNEEHRLLKMRARPKILVAATYEEAMALHEKYKAYLFGVVSDTRFPREGVLQAQAGVEFLRRIKADIPDLPVLLISNESHNRAAADSIPAQFLDKNSPHLFDELHAYFLDHIGFGDFVFRLADGSEVARASNLRQLEQVLWKVPDEPLCYHASRNRFSNWIMARSEIALASQIREVQVSDFADVADMRHYLISNIHGLRKWRQKGVVGQFNPKNFDTQIADIVKIGHGSLGGKARGLAFVANLLRQSLRFYEKFPGIDIRIPPTLVLTTEGFDAFVRANNLRISQFSDKSDAQISAAFDDVALPTKVGNDLSAYLRAVRYPLSVRSSSLLEDAHHQPLAGLYKTVMIPNNHADHRIRLAQLMAAVKQVYASTWFEQPRRFTRSTAFRHRKEHMAVMIQQIAGRVWGDYYYPDISGLARSQNYYPIAPIRPGDGMAKIALGFGKIIGAGEGGLRFCPKYPAVLPDFSKTEDILANAQQLFYALPLKSDSAAPDTRSDLYRRHVADALEEPPVMRLLSTYLPQDDRIRDSATLQGPKLVTFAGILKHGAFPLAEVLIEMLTLGREGMGCHVELEFAVDLPEDPDEQPIFHVLQMRPMSVGSNPFDATWTEGEEGRAVCSSSHAMGHGQYGPVTDIVFVNPDAFDAAQTRTMATEIGLLNAGLKAENRSYLLVGPGRWGSFDPWLGIPVKWEDIDGACSIVELRNSALNADPSQGSHFFQQITTQGLPYLTVNEGGQDFIQWAQVRRYPLIRETKFIHHVRPSDPLIIKVDGRSTKSVILPVAAEDIPPGGP